MEKTNVMRILEQNGIEYKAHEYEHGKDAVDGITVAKLLGQNPENVYKTLVTKGNGKDYYVFVIPVGAELNLKKAAKAVGEKSVEMIHVSEINKVTGYIRGGCSPVGMKKQYKTVFAEECILLDSMMVSAGKIGFQIETAPNDLIQLIDAQLNDITV